MNIKAKNPIITQLKPEDRLMLPCSVCGDTTIMRFKDSSVDFKVGFCCAEFLLRANTALNQVPGVRTPQKNETPNN